MNTPSKSGQLTIVGSGIRSIGQLTLEAVAHIEQADIVFYVVADSATEAFIQKKNPNCVDLYKFYDDGKTRLITYVQMSEVMLMHLREGKIVVGVFYGHPGVFVSPTHRTINIALKEGYAATMLPGISAEDCLFADLNIDPSHPGCLTYEATDLLVAKRLLIPSSRLILFQVGCVGISDFSFSGFNNVNFNFLLDYLEDVYGVEQPVIHYIGGILPFSKPVIEKYTIAELRNPEAQNKITAISTFYLPPKMVQEQDKEVLVKLGMVKADDDIEFLPHPSLDPEKKEPKASIGKAYSELESRAKVEINSHVMPERYRALSASSAMVDLMTKLALDPKALATYQQNPNLYIDSTSGLTLPEIRALKLGNEGSVIRAMKERNDEDYQPANIVVTYVGVTVEVVIAIAIVLGLEGEQESRVLAEIDHPTRDSVVGDSM